MLQIDGLLQSWDSAHTICITSNVALFSVQTHVNCAPATSSFTEAAVTVSTMTLHVYVLLEALHQFGTCIITVSVNKVTMKSINNGTCSFVIRVKLVAIPICDCSGHHLKHITYSQLRIHIQIIALQRMTILTSTLCLNF